MKTYTVPVSLTISGWISVHADSTDQAKEKASNFNLEVMDIMDPEYYGEVHSDEIEVSSEDESGDG